MPAFSIDEFLEDLSSKPSGVNMLRQRRTPEPNVSTSQKMVYLGFAFGCVAIIVVLASIFLVGFVGQNFDQHLVYTLLDFLQLILAMALAGVASAIPGFLEVFTRYSIPKRWVLGVRAGGALAVFVLILVLRPADGLKEMVNYNRTLADAKLSLGWSRSTSGNVAGPNAYELCQELVRLDVDRWEGYYCLARYHFFRREYMEMSSSARRSLVAYVSASPEKVVDSAFIKTARIKDLDGIEIIRNVALAEMGLVRFQRSDPSLARAAFKKSSKAIRQLNILSRELPIDLSYDEELLELIVWLGQSPQDTLREYNTRRKRWSLFIENGLGPYSIGWAYYHRAAIDAHVARLVDEWNTSIAGRDGRGLSTNRLWKEVQSDIILCLTDIRKDVDSFPTQKEWLKYYLLGEGNPKSPRSVDPYLSEEIRVVIASNDTIQTEVRKLLT